MSMLKRVLSRLLIAIERTVTAALYPVCRLREFLSGTVRVPILMYHQVGPPVDGGPLRTDCVTPQRFERQMRAILDAGYRVVALHDLVRILKAGRIEDLRRSVVLTFDDGYRGQFVFAWPVLQRMRLPATFFVTTGIVGKPDLIQHLRRAPARLVFGDPIEPRHVKKIFFCADIVVKPRALREITDAALDLEGLMGGIEAAN